MARATRERTRRATATSCPQHPGVAAGLALWILIAVLTPVAEELFFRGLMLRAIGRRWSIPIAVVVSSIVFGLFH